MKGAAMIKPKRTFATMLGAVAFLATLPATASAPQRPYYGLWLIAEAHPAPWYNPSDPGTRPFDDHLVGKSIVYSPSRIVGPRLLACKRPHYRMLEVGADYLFQGGLTAPAAQAAALGFRGNRIATLETGCAGAIDFHFINASTALFALDNMVYTLRKQAR
jgi:hypothetical protein